MPKNRSESNAPTNDQGASVNRGSRLLAATLAIAASTLTARAEILPQNDAGSGADAPDAASSQIALASQAIYEGMLEGPADPLDRADWYAIQMAGPGYIKASHVGPSCFALADATGSILSEECSPEPVIGSLTLQVEAAGLRYLVVFDNPGPYKISVGINAAAGDPLGVTGTLFGTRSPLAPVAPARQSGDHVVMAVVDTGINPYHEFFRAPALQDHPSTWLPGFPSEAEPLELTFGHATTDAARAADATMWASVVPSAYDDGTGAFTTHLYTFPGTRVVGAVSFGEYVDTTDVEAPPTTPILDDHSHGSASSGLAAGANMSAADGNVLIVMVEIGKGTFEEGVLWAARQPWIDAISVSLGTVGNVGGTGLAMDAYNRFVWGETRMSPLAATGAAASSGKPVFVSSGNGISGQGLLTPDRCSTYTSEWTGPQWVTRIGAADGQTGNPKPWYCTPVDAIAKTGIGSVGHTTSTGISIATGTSASAPNVAGHFARLLLESRRAGDSLSRNDVLDRLLRSAAPVFLPPGTDGISSPYPLSAPEQGYGLVDGAAWERALQAPNEPAPARLELQTWFEADAAVRSMLWGDPSP